MSEPSLVSRVVILVDDDPLLTRAMARVLKGRYITLQANSGEEARRIIDTLTSPFDAVVSDFDMGNGRMNGGQFLAWVESTHPTVRRVLCTGNPDPVARSAQRILAKPASLADLVSAIEQE